MTLFQSLATSAGYDPVKGPGSSCLADDASGQCVLPWSGGHKAVSSVVLVANGVSFAVRLVCLALECRRKLITRTGHDPHIHNHWVRGGLWHLRAVVAVHPHRDMLGRAVREHVPDV